METFVERMPTEQLKVFISSAQSQEGAFIWKDVRRRIKDRLSLCPCLAPYIIEDVASPIPSTQLFLMQVEKCDLYVLLLKGEGRKGTLSEFACAYNINKPMLVYFLKDDTPDTNVIAIKQKLIKNDRCTFRELSDFSNIESSIWKEGRARLTYISERMCR